MFAIAMCLLLAFVGWLAAIGGPFVAGPVAVVGFLLIGGTIPLPGCEETKEKKLERQRCAARAAQEYYEKKEQKRQERIRTVPAWRRWLEDCSGLIGAVAFFGLLFVWLRII